MTKLAVVITVCFVVSFAAGGFAGALWERSVSAAKLEVEIVKEPSREPAAREVVKDPPREPRKDRQGRPPPPPNWMAELKLTSEQNEKMKEVWSDVMKQNASIGSSQRERRDAIRKEKEEGQKALLTDEQRKKFDEIDAIAEAKFDELNKQGKTLFDDAVRKTEEFLTAEQRATYKKIREQHSQQGHRRPEGRPEGRPDWRQGGRPDGKPGRPDGRPEGRQERMPETKPDAGKDQTQNQKQGKCENNDSKQAMNKRPSSENSVFEF